MEDEVPDEGARAGCHLFLILILVLFLDLPEEDEDEDEDEVFAFRRGMWCIDALTPAGQKACAATWKPN